MKPEQHLASVHECENAKGFLESAVDPLRYERRIEDTDDAAAIIVQMIPVGGRILDVGCGTGLIARRLRDGCRVDVIGIEPNCERATFASARDLEVHNALLTEGPFNGSVCLTLSSLLMFLNMSRTPLHYFGLQKMACDPAASSSRRYPMLPTGRSDGT